MAVLSGLGDSQSRLSWLVERARRLPGLAPEDRVDANRVQGCQARVWLKAERAAGRWTFRVDSDAATLKALGSLLGELAGGSPDGAGRTELETLERLGLLRHLAPSRKATVLRIAETLGRIGAGVPGLAALSAPCGTAAGDAG